MLSAGVKNLEDLTDLFIKHAHTGRDFSTLLPQIFVINHVLPGATAATSTNYSVFFNSPYAFEILGMQESHTTAGSDANPVSFGVERLPDSYAPGSGLPLLASGFNLKATADTIQDGSLTNTKTDRFVYEGDRLAMKLAGTPTAVANVVLTLKLRKI